MDSFVHNMVFGLLLLFTNPLLACDDVDSGACQRFADAKPDMCNVTCLASVCKRHCGLCPLRCYSCNDIKDPTKCNNSVECSTSDQRCISVSSFTDNFEEFYKLGCAPASVCSGHRCCGTDLCNRHSSARRISSQNLPSLSSPVRSVKPRQTVSPQCADVDEVGCTILFTTNINMCQDDCISNVICPRFCGKCSTCYDCDHVMSTERCMNLTTCKVGEVCFTLETLNFDLQHGYRLGCVPQQVCDQMKTQATNIFGRRSGNIEVSLTGGCCHGDLCNHHNIHQTTTQLPSTTRTTTTTTTTQKVCNIVDHGCPFSPDMTKNDKCYLVGHIPMNHMDAQEHCKSVCAHLAEFPNGEHDMHDIVSHILRHSQFFHYLDDDDRRAQFYVGAINPVHGTFVWESSRVPVPTGMFYNAHSISAYDCAIFDYHSELKAVSCTTLAYPICQADRRDD